MEKDIQINIAKLEQKVDSMSLKVDKIDEHLEKIYSKLDTHYTEVVLLKQKQLFLETKIHSQDKVIEDLQKELKANTKKLTGIFSVILFVGWLIGFLIAWFK